MSLFEKKKIFYKDLFIAFICIIIYGSVFFSIKSSAVANLINDHFPGFFFQEEGSFSGDSFTLAPTLRMKPMIDIKETEDGYVIVEEDVSASEPRRVDIDGAASGDERLKMEEVFKDDVAFVYLSRLLARALQLGITEQGLKELIAKHLSHVDFRNFLWRELYSSQGAFCIPYLCKDTSAAEGEFKKQLLKFYLDDGTEHIFAEEVVFSFGDVKAVVEDPVVPRSLPREDDEGLPSSGIPGVLSSFANPSGMLPVEVKIKSVKRRGPVMFPEKEKEEYMLNAGVLDIDNKRLLFARRATEIAVHAETEEGADIRRSEIGLFVHDIKNRAVVEVDRQMLVPDGESIVAYEDARVIERSGTIYVYMTAVERDGSYYSVVTTHPAESFMANLIRKSGNPEAELEWEWSEPRKIVQQGRYSEQNNKNFVPFANPVMLAGKQYWCGLYRPDEDERSSIRMAVSEEGLAGPWHDAGPYMKMSPREGWLGASAYVAEMPSETGRVEYDFMLYHKAGYRDGEKKSKYYDIRLIVSDRNNPLNYYATEPILVPEEGYELRGWVPGAIYSCGAVLTEYNLAKGEYVFDVYYSGSDTAVLLATVTIQLEDTDTEHIKARMIRQARESFGDIHEAFRRLESSRTSAFERASRASYIDPTHAYYDLGKRTSELRDRAEAWRIKWAAGFGVDKQLRGMISQLDNIISITDGRKSQSASGIHYGLNAPFNSIKVYLLNARTDVLSLQREVDTSGFVEVPAYKTPANIRTEFDSFCERFQDLERVRDHFFSLDGESLFSFRTAWRENMSFVHELERKARGLKRDMEEWNAMWGKQAGIHKEILSVIDALGDIEQLCHGREISAGGGNNLRDLYYRLNSPFNRASVRFLNARYSDGWLRMEDEINRKNAKLRTDRMEENLRGKTSEAMTFMDTLRLRAYEARKQEERIIIGLDTSWIPGMDSEQGIAIQSLLSAIYKLEREEGLNNVLVVRGKGEELAASLLERAQKTNTSLGNVVVLGSEEILRSEAFSALRSTPEEKRAFLVGVDAAKLTENSYIRILKMMSLAIKLSFGEIDSVHDPKITATRAGPRFWVFIPEAEPYDLMELKRIYDTQLQALVAA
ncbi:MAG: hypothetical protein GF409_05795 [Candidatus Omnitrophica bacterium]|nr:hypothetical protein [Candidatus Omnitrophota bacterium]